MLTCDEGNVSVPNPYVWLEHPESEESQDYVVEQTELFDSFIADVLTNRATAT